ncbi:hypothetical protein [Roseibium sp. MMSF_3544]|uniref:hypothetical protein n=1 Tax=unclassified Roseibium TaxID=2629323 RepID=UPI00273EDAB6|nr:hypothetical protein [Roseibium sp. MMSF_3544]
MQILRQERHPLVALATLAFSLRLCLVILATAFSADRAAASGLSDICRSPAGQEQSVPWSHDMLACQCGPVCSHGCAQGSALAGSLSAAPECAAGSGACLHDRDLSASDAAKDRVAPIRGPPSSVI